MYAKVVVLVCLALAFSQCYAQTPTCGNVQIPQMTPVQAWNWYSWYLPGAIAASDCYTQYLMAVQNAWTGMNNGLYTAGPPAQTAQQAGQQAGQTAQQNTQQAGQTGQQAGQTGQTGQQAGQQAGQTTQ